MADSLLLILLPVIAIVLGFILGKLFSGLKYKGNISKIEERNNQLSLQIDDLKNQLTSIIKDHKEEIFEIKQSGALQLEKTEKEREEIRREKDFLSTELTRRNSEFENLQLKNTEQKAEVEKLQEKFTKEFENLANKILDQKSEKFTSLNKENIQNILKPLQEKIKTFEEKVDKNSTDFIERHAQLGKQLQFLNEQNLKISEEATNLTKALKGDTKMQGNWGEMVLERVLERSGLQKDSEYFVQQNFHTENGKRAMPDVVIHLPGEKKMIIDSKVSLNAYERYINEDEEKQRPGHLKNHLISVKKRVEELSAKNYHNLYQMESPDFVLLFIPIEAAFAIASNQNPNLYSEAFEKNIIIVTPTTLLAVLKTIDSMWQNEKQKQNAIEIATRAGALYDSFVNLTNELEKVGKQLGTVQNTYEGAMKKLTGKGNLIGKVEYLRELGAKTNKQLDGKLLEQAKNEEEEKDQNDRLNLN
ncbi:DNA recombination protein RmuC [Salegentibacter flavus]|uniref:DNA recombination protein RmuC n=1 Tax=Salegentibacter flavus TaxID=287099 RepID=A0A1I4YM05_9FLAO|nr:DNA recombination protein RmuC [Salegentibacter flavus]SFN38823.1 DNA recombination protein RmuC [Salegentibacter flavus]